MILPKDFTNNSISYSNNLELKICILAFLFPFQLETSGNLDACTKQIENWAEKLKLEILIYLCIDFIYMYDWYIILTRILLRTQKCIIHDCMISAQCRGPAALWKVRGLRGGTFFRATFYCVFGRFGKVTHLVNFKKWGGSSPPPLPLLVRGPWHNDLWPYLYSILEVS